MTESKCVVCHKRDVEHKHVICRPCNERIFYHYNPQYHTYLSPEEEARYEAEMDYRASNPLPEDW